MMKALLILALLVLPVWATDAGTMTFDYAVLYGIKTITVAWESDSSGAVSGSPVLTSGELIKLITYADTTTAYRPSAAYDIAITGTRGINILTACSATLANCDSSTAAEEYLFLKDVATTEQSLRPVVNEALTIAVTNAGVHRRGWLYIYYRD